MDIFCWFCVIPFLLPEDFLLNVVAETPRLYINIPSLARNARASWGNKDNVTDTKSMHDLSPAPDNSEQVPSLSGGGRENCRDVLPSRTPRDRFYTV